MKQYPLIGKCLAVGIILVFLSTACLPVLANEGKPDLVPTNIYVYIYNEFSPPRYTLVVDVENHGNASVKGSIQFRISAQRLLFGKFPLRTRTFEGSYTPDFDFFPGSLCLLSVHYHPIFLFGIPFCSFKLNCRVNPDKTIDEWNYSNNFIEKKYSWNIL
jgi:hypothetical protein